MVDLAMKQSMNYKKTKHVGPGGGLSIYMYMTL